MWIRNNKGSTLITTMIAVMILAITSAGFSVAITGISNRSLTVRQEKQVYLSARSVAHAVAVKLEEDSYGQIMNLSITDRNIMTSLPDEMRIGESVPLNLSRVQSELIQDVGEMLVGQSIELGEVSWNDGGSDLDMGQVEVTINKVDEASYIVEAKATSNEEEILVKTSLSSTYHELIISQEVLPEDQENWNGGYTDYGYLIEGEFDVEDSSSVVGNGFITTSLPKDGIYHSQGTIIIDGEIRDSGTIVSDTLIYLRAAELKGHKLYAKDEIYIGESTSLETNIHTEELNLSGDNIEISQGISTDEIQVKTLAISGNNILIDIPVQCEILQIEGDNISFTREVKANQVDVSGNDIELNYNQEQVISYQDYDIEMAIRHKPEWANYDASQIQLFHTGENDSHSESVNKIGTGYYWISEDMNMIQVVNKVYQDGMYQNKEESYVSLDIQSYLEGNLSYDNPAVIIIRDGQNLLIEQPITSEYVYLLLEGNARVRLPEGESKVRIYGEPVNSGLKEELNDKLNEIISATFTENWRNQSSIDTDELKDKIYELMATYEGDMNRIELVEDTSINGTFVVPYVKSEADFTWKLMPYQESSTTTYNHNLRTPTTYTGTAYYLYEYQGYVK